MPLTPDDRTAERYWAQTPTGPEDLLGVAALGGCGRTEAIYRHHEEVRHFSRVVPLSTATAVLEIGCGNGRWVTTLAPRVACYEAVDFSPAMLAVAQRRAVAARLTNVRFVAARAQDYSPSHNFEVIYLSGVTQYLHDEDVARMLDRLLPHLAPGGVVVDRSTVHRRVRSLSDQPDYFSIYRTGDEVVRLYGDHGLVSRYRAPSYAFLGFGQVLRRLLGCGPVHALVAGTAPLSFTLLRAAANVRARWLPPTGELADYSHEFFVFNREATI